MRKLTILMMTAVLVAVALAPNAHAQIREERPNIVGGELLGRGFALTLNYERYLNNTFGLGAGLMAIGSDDGSVIIAPLYFSIVPGDIHSVYLSAGTTIFAGGGSLDDYESTSVMTAAVGYQYQSAGGFFVRPLFSFLIPSDSNADFLLWPGITIGGSF